LLQTIEHGQDPAFALALRRAGRPCCLRHRQS
jgi:hypothetical protein